MSNIIDFFSRKPVRLQDTESNDKEAKDEGVYVGQIHEVNAEMIRNVGVVLDIKARQMQELVAEWEELATDYHNMIDKVVSTLGIQGYDPTKQKLQVSEDGHCWLVDREPAEPDELWEPREGKYSIICTRCNTYIGDADEEPSHPICMDCYEAQKK